MQLLVATQYVFDDLVEVLSQIDERKYGLPLEVLSGSSIGQHTRHAIEFFSCLLRQNDSGIINYDRRERDGRIEGHANVAKNELNRIISELSKVAADKPVLLETTFSESEDDYTLVPSSFHREWSYALEHAIHHLAIIKIGLGAVAPEVKVPDNFGVGPATVKHRQRQCAQ